MTGCQQVFPSYALMKQFTAVFEKGLHAHLVDHYFLLSFTLRKRAALFDKNHHYSRWIRTMELTAPREWEEAFHMMLCLNKSLVIYNFWCLGNRVPLIAIAFMLHDPHTTPLASVAFSLPYHSIGFWKLKPCKNKMAWVRRRFPFSLRGVPKLSVGDMSQWIPLD